MSCRALIASLAVFASLGAGLTACGGSSKKDDGLSRAELGTKANAICKAGETALAKIPQLSNIQDAAAAAAYFSKVAPVHQNVTDQLAALKPAADVKVDWAAFMVQTNANNALLKTIEAKAEAKDASGLDDVKKLQANDVAYAAVSKKVGATECGGT